MRITGPALSGPGTILAEVNFVTIIMSRRAPVTADRLQPFAEPSLCIAHLKARPEPTRRRKTTPP